MNCTICSKKNKSNPAEKFCSECNKYFCGTCMGAHDIVHDDHTLTDPDNVIPNTSEVLPTERCVEHPAEIVKMFCRSHDLTMCNTCAFMKHRMCEDVVYIPGEISKLMPESEIEASKQLVGSFINSLAEIQNAHKSEDDKIKQEKQACLDQIEDIADKLIAKIKAMKQAAVDNVEEKFVKLEKDQEANSPILQGVEEQLLSCLRQLEDSKGNLPQAFVTLKKSQELLSKVKELRTKRSAEGASQNHTLNFLTETGILEYLEGFQALASFKKPQKKQLRREPDLQVKQNWDNETCDITGACSLPDGVLLLADAKNKKLKHVNTATNTILDICALNDQPFAVCSVGQHEAAVTLGGNKFQFVSLGVNKMSLLKSYSPDHGCYGIVFSSGELFVTDGDSNMYIYNKLGQLQRKVDLNLVGGQHITVSPKGERIYVACQETGMVCVSRKGEILYRCQGSDGCKGFGVCTDCNGSLYISGIEENRVVQFREGGETVGDVISHEGGIVAPQAVVIDLTGKRMFVSQHNSNVMCVFALL